MVQQNDYYAFGLRYREGINAGGSYKYEYNGKELQEEIGMYDYGARFYMPELGRWGVVDPMAEVTPHVSPYHYANNNPLMFNDPTGMLSQSFIDNVWNSASGTTWYNTGIGFTSSGGNSMDYDGNPINWGSGATGMLMMSAGLSPMGGGGGGVGLPEILIPELVMWGKGNRDTWSNSFNFDYNSAVLRSGIMGAQADWNIQQAMSEWQTAINETKIGKSIGALERGLFLELPMQFAGGALLSAGWKAVNFGKLGLNLYSKIISSNSNRVFWSGGKDVLNVAMQYAKNNGAITLEMTNVGKGLSTLGNALEKIVGRETSWKIMEPVWKTTSKAYATGTQGVVQVFHNATYGIRIESVWGRIEYGILNGRNPIIYNNVFIP
ncbi:RHS repeat domain-containing protein [Chryseobacterium luquanense]|uniref:RHS repeat-associated core domain-containing protein n=1 Tax=Chryseobacterium luquanense TaxID=2983766 RepID=A0ABT3Y1B0_9FLAO|nr:RHS repeat-associated core domain-containing protein [Chryseobacterium luquanense]MCX8531930.1 RHS repeat-associated core domain-containing protein [Chryseobacterium luquanense]